MRCTFTRGTRRLLVTAGVMSLGLAVVSPGTVWANNGGDTPIEGPSQAAHANDSGGADTAEGAGGAVLGHCHLTANGAGQAIWIPSNAQGIDDGHADHQGGEEALVSLEDCVALNGGGPVGDGGNGNDNAGGGNENAGGGNENAGGGNENAGGGNENAGGGNENAGGGNENAGGGNDNAGGGNDNAGGGNDNAGGGNENAGGGNDNAGGGNDNAGGGNENAGGGNENAGGGNENAGGGNENAGGGNENAGDGDDDQVTPVVEVPVGPVVEPSEETPRQPQPVIISTDQVELPVATEEEPEVMGVTTTRTPTPQVAGSTMQTLPRTGADHTVVLAAAGGALVLAGLALELASRRRQSVAGGLLPTT